MPRYMEIIFIIKEKYTIFLDQSCAVSPAPSSHSILSCCSHHFPPFLRCMLTQPLPPLPPCNYPLPFMSSLPPPPLPHPHPHHQPPQLPLSSPVYHQLSHIPIPSLPILFYFHLNSHLLVCPLTPFVIPLSLLVYAHRHTPYYQPLCLINLLCLHDSYAIHESSRHVKHTIWVGRKGLEWILSCFVDIRDWVPGKVSFCKRFRENNKLLEFCGRSNKAVFVVLAEYYGGACQGCVMIPASSNRADWSLFQREMRNFFIGAKLVSMAERILQKWWW